MLLGVKLRLNLSGKWVENCKANIGCRNKQTALGVTQRSVLKIMTSLLDPIIAISICRLSIWRMGVTQRSVLKY